jgi:hypothetical protein
MGDPGRRDPDLLGRAQRAATELKRASDRWHTRHGLGSEAMPTVSGYVGYSLERPSGQPRVVFRIEANQAEQLAALLDRHDSTGPGPLQPLHRAATPGRHAAGRRTAVSAGTAQGTDHRHPWQAYGATAQALAEPPDDTGPRGYPLQRHERLHAVPSEPDTDFRAWQARAAQYSQVQEYVTSLRAAAEKEAAAIREQAAQQAASLTREAAQEAARIREVAQQAGAELRAALAAMSEEMGRVAAYVSENLIVPPIPAGRPAAVPAPRPTRSTLRALRAAPDTRPGQAPATQPARRAPGQARPATAPAVPGKEPGKRTRQQNAMRVSKFAVAAGLLGVAATASTEFALHGPSFFVFRQSGTGETPGNFTDQDFLAREQAKPVKPKPQVVQRAAKTAKHAPKSSP